MKKLKVIQIGVGHAHGTSAFNSILKQKELFDVVGFAVPESEEKDFSQIIAEYRDDRGIPFYSVEDALNLPGIEGAVIETEEKNLTKYAIMAAERGLHIHMDKPGGFELAEFERLTQILKSKKLTLSLGYMYRFNPKIIEAMEKIKNGEIGEVYCVEAHMDCEYDSGSRDWLGQFPGGMMFFLGCHLVDLIYRIQGEPDEVIPMNCATGFDDIKAKDYSMVLFKYPRGISFAKSCAKEIGGYARRQLVICGSEGTIEMKPIEFRRDEDERDYLYTEMREIHHDQGWFAPGTWTNSGYFNRFDEMIKNYAESALGIKENPYTIDYELSLYKLLLRCCGK